MTNVLATPEKRATRSELFEFAVETLQREGWTVSRIPNGGKASLRLIAKGAKRHKVSIRTSQDTWIAFPRKTGREGWVTLDDVDFVVAVSVNDRHNPTVACVHMIPGENARARFNRAYTARKAAGHALPDGRGIWLALYEPDGNEPISRVGGGMGLDFPPIATLDLTRSNLPTVTGESGGGDDSTEEEVRPRIMPLTIPEAKRLLAASLGVPESAITISVAH
jgi:hypothetical protein